MTFEEIEARMSEIKVEMEADGADLSALNAEVDTLMEERAKLEARAAEKRSLLDKVANSDITPIAKVEERENIMSEVEIRNTPAYVEAYANYIKSGSDKECRSLLTENATNGTVPVPELVYDVIKTAWEREGVTALVRKSFLKGNLKVGFEISGSDAVVHTEGQAVNEETLVLGVVDLTPVAIKKWISISDEALDMTGEAYVRYIYDELTYRIAKKAADTLIAKIEAAGTQSTATSVGVPAITESTIAQGTIANAIANLSDEAVNPVIIMNKATWADFKAVQYAGKYAVDVFEGLNVVFNSSIKSFTAASTGDTYAIVGDLDQGALMNFPNGQEITVKRDDYTLATSDLVRFIGREFVGIGVVAPNAFVKIKK